MTQRKKTQWIIDQMLKRRLNVEFWIPIGNAGGQGSLRRSAAEITHINHLLTSSPHSFGTRTLNTAVIADESALKMSSTWKMKCSLVRLHCNSVAPPPHLTCGQLCLHWRRPSIACETQRAFRGHEWPPGERLYHPEGHPRRSQGRPSPRHLSMAHTTSRLPLKFNIITAGFGSSAHMQHKSPTHRCITLLLQAFHLWPQSIDT